MDIIVRISNADDANYALAICKHIEESARLRHTGIAKRDPESIKSKIIAGSAVIAFCDGKLAGFCYIEDFKEGKFVSNSGMIVLPSFRQLGISKLIKYKIFNLSRERFPNYKIFSITTNLHVLNMNLALGFKPVSFSKLINAYNFWKGCKSCMNYDILSRNKHQMCLCTGLLYDPKYDNYQKELKKISKIKIILAYSGGLDTSFCLKYLTQQGYEVHTSIVNTGGFSEEELSNLEKMAYELGAKSHRRIDAIDDYYHNCLKYLIYGNILRNNKYPLSVSSERIFQAIKIAEYAIEIDANAIAHGSTVTGNDQVRFDIIFNILCPKKLILSPLRDIKISRQEEMDYLREHGVNISWEGARYSINKGIWGTSISGVETLSSNKKLPEHAYLSRLQESPRKTIKLGFEKGEFISLNGARSYPVNNILRLENISSCFAIGHDMHVGDTLLGIKGRIGFEASSAFIIIKAHSMLENHILTKWQISCKAKFSDWYGMFLHESQYLDPVMRNIESFLEDSQKRVTGQVNVELQPYRFEITGVESPFDIMQAQNAKYGEINKIWSTEEVKGFIKIFGNYMKIYHSIKHD